MVTKYFAVMFAVLMLFTDCTPGRRTSIWLLEWHFIGLTDTVLNSKTLAHEITVNNENCGINTSEIRDSGLFVAQLSFSAHEDDINEFSRTAQVHVRLWSDSTTIFDSILPFGDLDFKSGYSSIYSYNQSKVSTKTFKIKE